MAEPAIGRGFNFGNTNYGRTNTSSMTKFAAKVTVDGLTIMERTLDKIARHTERIRSNMQAVNATGREGGFWRNLFGGQSGGGTLGGGGNNSMASWMSNLPQARGASGTAGRTGNTMGSWIGNLTPVGPTSQVSPGGGPPPQQPTGPPGGNSMPWMSRVGIGAAVVGSGISMANNMLAGRFGRNVAESTPISAQNMLMASMYSGVEYRNIENARMQALGQFGGTRQDAAATQQMALRFGQTPAQAGRYMQGVGVAVQAMGGTMTAPQIAQTTGSFLDPMVMRRQQALGMPLARQAGQVQNPMEIAQNYIKTYERINGGRKLNEFDFINLQTPGSPLRLMFQNFFGLDDAAIDMIVTAGMQGVQSRGGVNYRTGAGLAQLGLDRNKLGLAAPSLQTAYSRREAGHFRAQEGAMVGRLRTEETLQNTLAELEDATSALTGAFHRLERVITLVGGGIGMLGGGLMLGGMMGGGGGGGGGGILGRALGGVGAVGGGGGAGGGGGGFLGGMGGAGGLLRNAARGVGVGVGVGGIQQAVNARNWGDMFSSVGMGAAGGAMVAGLPGAVVGGAVTAGTSLFNIMHNRNVAATERQSTDASHLTDKQIVDKLQGFFRGSGISGGHNANWKTISGGNSDEMRGMLDRFQVRRAALIVDFMKAMESTDPNTFASYIEATAKAVDKSPDEMMQAWADLEIEFTQIANSLRVDDDKYRDAGEKFIEYSMPFRGRQNRGWSGFEPLNNLYRYFFGDIRQPMDLQPIYTEPAFEILDRYEVTGAEATEAVQQMVAAGAEESGDPENTNVTSTNLTGPNLANMPMAKPPNDRSWTGLDARMKKRLLALFAASQGQVTLGGGGGTRSTEQQRTMFLDRYRVDPNGEVEWQGKRWHRVKGAAAAPPGRSMHEIGMAADLAGPGVNNGWLKKNVARFGLKEFSNVNNEPWHVQLAEFPNSRREYEGIKDDGADNFGLPGDKGTTERSQSPVVTGTGGGGSGGIGGSSLSVLGGAFSSLAGLSSGGMGAYIGAGAGGAVNFEGTGGKTSTTETADPWTGGTLTGQQMAQMAYNAGFRGEGLIMAVAIAKRESGWNPKAHNPNRDTGDDSYGLFQINMLGDLGPARRKEYGIQRNEDLWDPNVNLRAAFKLSSGGTNWHHWGGYKGMADNYNTDMTEARSIVQTLGLGDAAFDSGMGGGGLMPRRGGVDRIAPSFGGGGGGGGPLNINVTIQSSGNYAYDAQQLAKAARPALEREYAEVSAKRGS